MPPLMDKIFDTLVHHNWQGATVLGLLVVIPFYGKALFQFFNYWGQRKEKFIRSALQSDILDDSTKAILKERFNQLALKRTTGIYGNQFFRGKVLHLLESSKGEIQLYQIAQAGSFLTLKNGKLEVSISGKDQIISWANLLFATLIGVLSVPALMFSVSNTTLSAVQRLLIMAVGIIEFALALFISSQNFPYRTAKRIKKKLDELEKKSAQTP